MLGVVLGNGPSKHRYNYEGDFIIGCNIPGDDFSVDATVITDVEIVWVLKNNPELIQSPLIVSTIAWEKMKELKLPALNDVIDVFKPKDWYTSGHYAALYLTNIMNCDTIHVWGCDSYYVDDYTTTTDQYVINGGSVFYEQWRRCWNRIIKDNPGAEFVIKR